MVGKTVGFGGFVLDLESGRLSAPDGSEVTLRPQSMQVLELLAQHAGQIVSRDDLIAHVWPNLNVTDDSLIQCIADIRRTLGDDDHKLIKTVPKRGYKLHATPLGEDALTPPAPKPARRYPMMLGLIAVALLVGVYLQTAPRLSAWLSPDKPIASTDLTENRAATDQVATRENLSILVQIRSDHTNEAALRLANSVVTALSRFSTIDPIQMNGEDAGQAVASPVEATDYRLDLSLLDETGASVNVQLFHNATNTLVIAENFTTDGIKTPSDSGSTITMGSRIAALIGSPAGGVISRHLIHTSRTKPVAALSRPECLAHGYGCTSCSGEYSSITPRAVQCLANLLERDPQDPDAWALQSTVFVRQYFWGSSLQEPMRSDKSKRGHLVAKAIEAATRAEALADGSNPSVYWGLSQAYMASCDAEKMQVAVDRGISINPNDPSMLAVLGNFLSYAGNWDEGKALVERALEMEPHLFQDWWYMALAKRHYREGDYQQAYEFFLKAFNERNWLSHLQLAYTLPHLGRVDEAKQALANLRGVAPSVTRERVYEFYRSYCFDDAFLARLQTAFDLIDMPSRGSGDDFETIRPMRAVVEQIGGRPVEYIDVGEGIPLVFVHGAISDYRTWNYMLLPISERYRYMALTMRLHGTLDWPNGDQKFDINLDVEDLIAFIEAKDIGPAYVVGWSSSADAISALARTRPDLLRGLIIYEPVIDALIDPTSNPEPPPEDEGLDFSGVLAKLDAQDIDGAAAVLFETVLEKNPGEFQTEPSMLQRIVLDNARTVPVDMAPDQPVVDCDFLKEIIVPGLILYGETTNPPWQYMSKRYADCLPDSERVEVKNANHDGPLSQPEQVVERIDTFIRKLRPQR